MLQKFYVELERRTSFVDGYYQPLSVVQVEQLVDCVYVCVSVCLSNEVALC